MYGREKVGEGGYVEGRGELGRTHMGQLGEEGKGELGGGVGRGTGRGYYIDLSVPDLDQ